MGILSTMRDAWANRRNSPLIASPLEDQKILRSRQCTQAGVQMVDANGLLICSSSPGKGEDRIRLYPLDEGVRAGVKAASIACVATAVPTLVAVRVLPWAKANLNYTAQALIISAGAVPEFGLGRPN
ncbi:hypothetical protein RHMOL_Rhmol04G0370100 [Rhododendron molle]|uniref:Uncharacterized protein n=3 Tax=Rhododendron molle TaxID=49168 RepID=A0ACC0P8C4_RHOML|nr:hypothetical protein RHMOL_Rhmol04G0370100 [Rhododendron molle]KAI8561807.1 hypothetical protein RHMOL_Rhmol04G0370100 [Rhododendron molle]KAI8561808.1 hypothetical protein RHMOL_Rhmol04G0370100 [Rhododendron molle]